CRKHSHLAFQEHSCIQDGCSDSQFFSLGGMHWLLWRAIQEGKENGIEEFDLGRSDLNNNGLILFKDRWGARCWKVSYLRCPVRRSRVLESWTRPGAKRDFTYMSKRRWGSAGMLLYGPHSSRR